MNWSDAADDGSPCSACWMKRTLLPRSALRVECVQVIVSCQRAAVCHHIRLALPPRDLARSHPRAWTQLAPLHALTTLRALTGRPAPSG
jgi:hypothetical protein